MGILEDLYRQVPLNARLFADSLRGVTTPVTERDLRPDELAVLQGIYDKRQRTLANETAMIQRSKFEDDLKRDLIANAQKTAADKQVGYMGYHPTPDQYNWLQSVYKTFTDPSYRIATSLGNFGMENQGNNLRFYDKYNWNGDFATPINTLGDLWKQASFARPTETLNALAEMFAPKVSRPVEINIPQK